MRLARRLWMFGVLSSPANRHDGPEPEESQHHDPNEEARDDSSQTARRLLGHDRMPTVWVTHRLALDTTLTIASLRATLELRSWRPANPPRAGDGVVGQPLVAERRIGQAIGIDDG